MIEDGHDLRPGRCWLCGSETFQAAKDVEIGGSGKEVLAFAGAARIFVRTTSQWRAVLHFAPCGAPCANGLDEEEDPVEVVHRFDSCGTEGCRGGDPSTLAYRMRRLREEGKLP